ncbi:protein EARLY RESPONSIVE TO DEHYDRATION 15-like [Oryza brachyantha]|uniref:Ataxin-2 C-terminal domain-containing protein n=1 Tax=Oryza brachyantha TaxID=4533 RepID=J3M641_ORYBR|nr:protein EARLY RESPONSIVE TO DEHYDRATION 15-like [Oryza brachyantha]
MEVASGKLNPWAEPFVPAGWSYYRCGGAAEEAEAAAEVEDFSPEWWRLVAASPTFRDRWLRDYTALGLLDADADEGLLLPDDDDLFAAAVLGEGEEKESKADLGFRGGGRKGEVVAWGINKWRRAHFSPPEAPRYAEKAPRRVAAGAARVSPRPIQQPR